MHRDSTAESGKRYCHQETAVSKIGEPSGESGHDAQKDEDMKFRKKPVVIEAWQWNETTTMLRMLEGFGLNYTSHSGHRERPEECQDLRIRTLEGQLLVSPGDWIIKGVKGEFYPCKPDIFEATYEPVEDL